MSFMAMVTGKDEAGFVNRLLLLSPSGETIREVYRLLSRDSECSCERAILSRVAAMETNSPGSAGEILDLVIDGWG